ncbi:MAG: PIG-L deacetylase family protein [Nanoarchaeota archaeon]
MKTIVVFSPHNDDLEVGLGGTVMKHLLDGYKVVKLVFSAGQMSNPHLKEDVITKRREREAQAVGRKFGYNETIFYRLTDQNLKNEISSVAHDVKSLLKNEKPEKIYVPASNDTHPDHKAVHNFAKKMFSSSEVYTYEVWSLTDEQHPAVYVDITPFFKQKLQMMKMFTSEKASMLMQIIPVYFRARKYGRKINVKYAEKFYKIK